MRPEIAGSLDVDGVELICLTYLSKSGRMHARQACLRVRRQAPSAKIMVALLCSKSGDTIPIFLD